MNNFFRTLADLMVDASAPDIQLFQTKLLEMLANSTEAGGVRALAKDNPKLFVNLTRALSVLIRSWTKNSSRSRGTLISLLADQLELLPVDIRRALSPTADSSRGNASNANPILSQLLDISAQIDEVKTSQIEYWRIYYSFHAELLRELGSEFKKEEFGTILAEEEVERMIGIVETTYGMKIGRKFNDEELDMIKQIYVPIMYGIKAEQVAKTAKLVSEGRYDPLNDVSTEAEDGALKGYEYVGTKELYSKEDLLELIGVLQKWTRDGKESIYIRLLTKMIMLVQRDTGYSITWEQFIQHPTSG